MLQRLSNSLRNTLVRNPTPPALAQSCIRMSLWAISDIHLSYRSNKDEFDKLQPRGPDDGLILAGDSAFGSMSCNAY